MGVFTGVGGAVTTIADTATDGLTGLGLHPSINDAGTAAFSASFAGPSGAVLAGDGTTLTTIADTSGMFSGFAQGAINNSGKVAFLGAREAGGGGYFVSDDLLDGLLELGDALFGSFVTGLETVYSFNDAGQLAFYYELADGRIGIARADPVPQNGAAPAPGSLVLLVLGLAALVGFRHAGGNRHPGMRSGYRPSPVYDEFLEPDPRPAPRAVARRRARERLGGLAPALARVAPGAAAHEVEKPLAPGVEAKEPQHVAALARGRRPVASDMPRSVRVTAPHAATRTRAPGGRRGPSTSASSRSPSIPR
jgi:hypothetical protein